MVFNNRRRKISGLSRNKKKRFSRRLFRFSFFVLFFGFLTVGVLYFLLLSGMFDVKEVRIEGAGMVSENRVYSSLVASISSDSIVRSFLGPKSVFFWSDEKLKALDLMPEIEGVSVDVDKLRGKVLVRVSELGVVGVWCIKDVQCYGFDSEGMVFTKAPNLSGHLILKIEDKSDRRLGLGAPVLKRSWLDNVMGVIDGLGEVGIFPDSIVVRELALEEWEARVVGWPDLIFSLETVPDDVSAVLEELATKVDLGSLDFVDFRVPEKVYYR